MLGPCTVKFLKVEQQLVKNVQYMKFDLSIHIEIYYGSLSIPNMKQNVRVDMKCTVLHD